MADIMSSEECIDPSTFSNEALRLMQSHGIAPTPRNYALWYHYAKGGSDTLAKEMNRLVAQALPFDEGLGEYLHEKYLADNTGLEAVEQSPRAVLADVLRLVATLSSETELYSQRLDERIAEIQGQSTVNDVRAVIGAIVESATGMKKSSADLQTSLSESRAEIEQLRKSLQDVTDEAQRDFLTGLFNRKAFERMGDELLAFARDKSAPLCLLMIDIDHFKHFNDTYGHLIGDEVLKMTARLLKDTLKGTDIVARFGGEEFIIILPATPIAGALVVAENIRSAIAGKEMRHRESGTSFGSVTVSIGIAVHSTEDTIPLLIRRADQALYDSKKAGRNRVTAAAA